MNRLLILLLMTLSLQVTSQPLTYENHRGEQHLCGPIAIEDLRSGSFSTWFQENYQAETNPFANIKWSKALGKMKVEIYLGTWCGDSKRWVPRFLKAWEDLGLDPEQVDLIALYGGEEKYKQGPNGEEKGLKIHRVPTFIFKQGEEEVARMVEFPRNDLYTDLAQIAMKVPSAPNYRAAQYMMDLLEEQTSEEIYENLKAHANSAWKLVGKSSELNTLGYVYLRSGRVEEALTVFHFNTYFFKDVPNVYDSYAEALLAAGETEKAIENYEKVLELDRNNEHAMSQLESLKTSSTQTAIN